jgi:hypothetical protein
MIENSNWDPQSLGYIPMVIEQSGRGERAYDIYSRLRAQEIVAIGVFFDGLEGLAGVLGENFVEALTQEKNFLGVDFDIRRLPLKAAQRLVNHHARVRQRVTLSSRAGCQQQRTHARGLTNTQRRHVGLDELHGIVDRHARRHRTARGIDVKGYILVRIF